MVKVVVLRIVFVLMFVRVFGTVGMRVFVRVVLVLCGFVERMRVHRAVRMSMFFSVAFHSNPPGE